MKGRFDVAVIGGGIVGLATGFRIAAANPSWKILVMDKEKKWGTHQTGHSSGVLHSGLYYRPGTYRARWCRSGYLQMLQFAEENDIPYHICGKLVVAISDPEVKQLHVLRERGEANGLEGLKWINRLDDMQAIEPNLNPATKAALWVPQTGVINYQQVAETMAKRIQSLNTQSVLHTDEKLLGVRHEIDAVHLQTSQASHSARLAVFCGGLQCDRLFAMDAESHLPGERETWRVVKGSESVPISVSELSKFRILPFRGDYFFLNKSGQHLLHHIIYPVPNPQLPFLGVHLTRLADGESVECGPSAVMAWKREGYGKLDWDLRDTLDSLKFPGTWKLLAKHWKSAIYEYQRAFQNKIFLRDLQRLVPAISAEHLQPEVRSGVRAQLVDSEGALVDDFLVAHSSRSIHVLNAPSPAATSSLAIGTAIQRIVAEKCAE